MNVLIVEDDPAVLSTLIQALKSDGFQVEPCSHGEEAMTKLMARSFDIIVLDIGLPGITGLDLANTLRSKGVDTPILFLTGRDSEEDVIEGLDIGADAYMTKPFSVVELRARLRAVGRRRSIELSHRLSFQDLELDLTTREASRAGIPLELTEVEFKLLTAIMSGKGEVRSREFLLREVWRINFDPTTGILDVHLSNLRKKLNETGPPILETVRGKGYRVGSA